MKIFLAGTFRLPEDAVFISSLRAKLEAAGHSVWSAPRDLGARYGQLTGPSMTETVEVEKKALLESDILVAVLRRSTPGTLMEIMFAHDNGVPVISYLAPGDDSIKMSPWIPYHSKAIARSEEELFAALR